MALIAAYNLDEATGTWVRDFSGADRGFNLVDAARRGPGLSGSAGSGRNGAVVAGGSSSNPVAPFNTASWSFSFRAKRNPSAAGNDTNLVQRYGADATAGPGVRITAGGLLQGRWIDSASVTNIVEWTPPGGFDWTAEHHIVMAYNRTDGMRTLYVDGALVASAVLAGAPILKVPATIVLDSHVADTRVDDLRLYSHALTADEAAADAAARVGAPTMSWATLPGASAASLTNPAGRMLKGTMRSLWAVDRHSWAGIFPTPTGWRLFPNLASPVAGAVIDDRQSSRITTYRFGGRTYVLAASPTESRLIILDAAGAVVSTRVVPLTAPDLDASPMALLVSPNGRVWVGVVVDSALKIARSNDDGATWQTNASVATFTTTTGVVDFFAQGTTTTVYALASANDGGGRACRSIVQAALNITGTWGTVTLPALPAGVTSDDHLSLTTVPGSNKVYALLKATNAGVSAMLMYSHTWTGGSWTAALAFETAPDDDGGGSAVGWSRPVATVAGLELFAAYGSIYTPQNLVARRSPLGIATAPPAFGPRAVIAETGDYSDSVVVPRSDDISLGRSWPLVAHDRATGALRIAWQAIPAHGGSTGHQYRWVGEARGHAPSDVTPPASGSASGTFAWPGSAHGHAPAVAESRGSAQGTFGWDAAASGHAPVPMAGGSAAGSYGWAASARGHAPDVAMPHGSASGVHAWPGAARGHAPVVGGAHGSAAGTHRWPGVARGHAPDVAAASGSAAGTFGWPGTARGHAPVPGEAGGSARGTFGWTGTARGHREARGGAVGAFGWLGGARGHAPAPQAAHGAAGGSFGWSAAARGHAPALPVPHGSAHGTFGWVARAGSPRAPWPSVLTLAVVPLDYRLHVHPLDYTLTPDDGDLTVEVHA